MACFSASFFLLLCRAGRLAELLARLRIVGFELQVLSAFAVHNPDFDFAHRNSPSARFGERTKKERPPPLALSGGAAPPPVLTDSGHRTGVIALFFLRWFDICVPCGFDAESFPATTGLSRTASLGRASILDYDS